MQDCCRLPAQEKAGQSGAELSSWTGHRHVLIPRPGGSNPCSPVMQISLGLFRGPAKQMRLVHLESRRKMAESFESWLNTGCPLPDQA